MMALFTVLMIVFFPFFAYYFREYIRAAVGLDRKKKNEPQKPKTEPLKFWGNPIEKGNGIKCRFL